MPTAHYERLSAMDASELALETRSVHMHIGGVSIFEAAPLLAENGAFDAERIERYVESRLHRLPRYRQRLLWTPFESHPVWVDDEHFNLKYHVRYTSIPRHAGERELKRLVGRIISQQLDRGKPLWEMWFVDGLPGDRIALVTKIHHCMADGVAGASLMTALMRTDREARVEPVEPWAPRPAPTAFGMVEDEVRRRAVLPLDALRAVAVGLADPRGTWREAREVVDGMREAIVSQLDRTLATPFNRPIGPHRRLDWASSDLATIKAIGKRLGGTVNDVVLSVFSGAIGDFLLAHGVDLGQRPFKALVPVSMRDTRASGGMAGNRVAGTAGNRVAFVIAPLPVAEPDPAARLEQVAEVTRRLKSSRMTRGTDALVRLLDATFPALFSPIARIGSGGSAYNLVVTNVPGPQFPTYFLGAKQLETYPFSPLFANQALTVTAFSYDGRLFWGFNSDWDALPDLHDLVLGVERELERHGRAAGIDPPESTELTREPAA